MKNWFLRAGALALALHLMVGSSQAANVLHRSDLPLSDSLLLTSDFVDRETPIKEHILT